MSAERPKVGISYPDLEFRENLRNVFGKEGIDAFPFFDNNAYDLIPGQDVDLLFRPASSEIEISDDIPTIIIDEPASEKIRSEQAIQYLEKGAEGYFPKDTHPRIITAFTKNILRREKAKAPKEEIIVIGDLQINSQSRIVTIGGNKFKLRTKEFDLLEFLSKNKGVIFKREKLLENVWNGEHFLEETKTRTVDVHVQRLRERIEGSRAGIKTVRGVGYGIVTLDKNEGEEGK